MWTLKGGAKPGPRFGVRRKVFSFRGPQNGVQILGPILRSTLHLFFRSVTQKKVIPQVGCEQVRFLHTTLLELGRTLLRALVFGTLFSPHFGVQRQSFFFKRNNAEAYVWPKSDTRQAQQKLRSNPAQHN